MAFRQRHVIYIASGPQPPLPSHSVAILAQVGTVCQSVQSPLHRTFVAKSRRLCLAVEVQIGCARSLDGAVAVTLCAKFESVWNDEEGT